MKASKGVFGEAFASCLPCFTCWEPLAFRIDEKPLRHDDNKRLGPVISDQPTSHPPLMAVSEAELSRPRWRRKVKKTFTPSLTSFSSSRSRAQTNASRPLLQISAPFEFRHVYSASFQSPSPVQRPNRPWESPLTPDGPEDPLESLLLNSPGLGKELSPILPDFSFSSEMTPPSMVHLSGRPYNDTSFRLDKSRSSTSFHIPRKNVAALSSSSNPEISLLNLASDRQTRTQTYTPSDMETIKERVASAVNELEELQNRIDDIIERQSLYTASRPSTAHSMARIVPDAAAVPVIPALPPAAPSFAERLNTKVSVPNAWPATASMHISQLEKYEETVSSTQVSQSMREEQSSPPPPPPLPLRLQPPPPTPPPLRKKKSFSRFSTLLPQGQPRRIKNQSMESITNAPRPLKGNEGYYQCVTPPRRPGRRSTDTFDTTSSWSMFDGDRSMQMAWSLQSTPSRKEEDAFLERSATFGKDGIRRPSAVNVGLAI